MFWATAPGTPEREAEERLARERGVDLRECKPLEGMAHAARPAKRRVIKVRPAHGGPWCVCDDWNGVGQMITDEGSFEVEVVDLTPEQYAAIPDDFPGW